MSRTHYKLGDRVRVTDTAGFYSARGKTGTVESFTPKGENYFHCRVELDDGSVRMFNFPSSLEPLVEDEKKVSVARAIGDALDDIELMMLERHKKYGAGNISKHGATGIHVRLDDKFSRLEAGAENFDDETVENTLDDIIGYALIWKLWIRKQWPGSE